MSAHLSTGMGERGEGSWNFFIKADGGQCQLTCLQVLKVGGGGGGSPEFCIKPNRGHCQLNSLQV